MLVTDATEQADTKLSPSTTIKLKESVVLDNIGLNTVVSYYIPESNFKQNGKYKLAFDITLDKGTLTYLGGHLHTASESTVKVDGKQVKNNFYTTTDYYSKDSWRFGFMFPEKFNIGDTKHIEVEFTADLYDNPTNSNKVMAIQPNRIYNNTGYVWNVNPLESKVTLSNIELLTYK